MTSRHLERGADAAASSTDASIRGADSAPADAAPADPNVIVFDNPESSFLWTCGWIS